jgi:cell division protein FtsI (penicillin-binding protein 3)
MKHLIKRPLIALSKHLTLWNQAIEERSILEMTQQRVFVAGGIFCLAFILIAARLVDVMLIRTGKDAKQSDDISQHLVLSRSDIVDRNGEILATHLMTASVYANPKVIINPREAAIKLSELFPEISFDVLLTKLTSDKGFIWLTRHIPPKLQQAVNQLGIPGVYLQKDQHRVYPYGSLVSHVLGYCGLDNSGLAGTEQYFDKRLRNNAEPLKLSIDIRVQHIVHDELLKGIAEFKAEGGNAMVMDIKTGEMLAMVSLPDFNPNLPNQNMVKSTFNRNTLGVYESGSTFKIFNTAIALETGVANINSRYDASVPINFGRHKISDFRGKNRVLTFEEAFFYSSNIAMTKMALEFGTANQRQYLKLFGLLRAPTIEVPEISAPLTPSTWRDITTVTISYGYGIAVSPLQVIMAIGGIINNGYVPQATLLHGAPKQYQNTTPIVSAKTSRLMRHLMRLTAIKGTGKAANVPGYDVIGKTGTSHKNEKGVYSKKARVTSFVGAFPQDNPQYIMVVMLDDPKPIATTYGYATGGWNVAPVSGKMIARIAPLLGVEINENSLEYNTDTLEPTSNYLMPASHVSTDEDVD